MSPYLARARARVCAKGRGRRWPRHAVDCDNVRVVCIRSVRAQSGASPPHVFPLHLQVFILQLYTPLNFLGTYYRMIKQARTIDAHAHD